MCDAQEADNAKNRLCLEQRFSTGGSQPVCEIPVILGAGPHSPDRYSIPILISLEYNLR